MEQNEKEPMNSAEDTQANHIETENNEKVEENVAENEVKSIDTDAKIAELNDKYIRLYSEFDNYRKRTIKEKADIIRSAGEDVFKAILPIIDDFERAIKANELVTEAEPIKEGVSLIYNKLKTSITSKGLEVLESIGKPFDDSYMEAITSIPAPSEDMKGKIIDEVEKGYKVGDKVIRFAKVVVAS